MSEPVYKVSKAIKVMYQAAGAASGETIQMDVYDEAQVKDVGQSAVLAEIGATGRYRGTFTPDAEGDWHVQIYDSVNNTGKVVKAYEIGGHDVDDIGDTTGLIKVQTDLLPGDPASQASVDAAVSASEAAIDAAITATEAVLDAAIDGIEVNIIGEIDDLESPAMVG